MKKSGLVVAAVFLAGELIADRDLFWRQPDGPHSQLQLQAGIVFRDDPVLIKGNRFRVLVLGDSCSRLSFRGPPWPTLLAERFDPSSVEVFNASIPGYTTYQGLQWLRLQLLDYEPDLVIVYFGWNDHWRYTGMTDIQYARVAKAPLRLMALIQRPSDPPPLRVPPEAFRANCREIIDLVRARGGKTLLVTAPSHFTPENRTMLVQTGYLLPDDNVSDLHDQYLAVVRNLGRHASARVFDFAALCVELAYPRLLLTGDGIHPTDLGHLVLAATLADDIARRDLRQTGPAISPVVRGQTILAHAMANQGHWTEALDRYRRAVGVNPEDSQPALGLAWMLATCPDSTCRNGLEALAILSRWQEKGADWPQFLDVEAAALAECGRFAEAAGRLRRALALLEQQGSVGDLAVGMRQRLAIFEEGKPYRLPSITAGKGATP
jgi:lysophospholipase L1-like esterase